MAMDFRKNPNLGLREKLRLAYDERKSSHSIDDTKRDRAGQSVFIIGLINAAILAMVIVNPVLYSDSDFWTRILVQGFGCVCVAEMFVNWLCIKYVHSNYVPFRHGTKPPTLALGERVINSLDLLDSHTNTSDRPDQVEANGTRLRKDANEAVPNVMYVVNTMPESENEPLKRTKYPYFSWTMCVICNRPRPPRCHHCPICRKCILRRDHHCYFAGNCIGYRNLRYFTVFLIWVAIASVYLWYNLLPYYKYHIMPYISGADLILPVTILRALTGYITFKSLYIISVSYLAAMFVLLVVRYLPHSLVMVFTGTTSFERENKMKIVDTRNVLDKLRSVFGHYWALNLLFPLPFWFEPVEDPVSWSSIKA